jgi:hypothetical protein
MTTLTIKTRSWSILPVGTSILALTLLLSSVGRSSIASMFDRFIQTVDAVTEVPCRIVNNIRHFSLDRLDPTCSQCF